MSNTTSIVAPKTDKAAKYGTMTMIFYWFMVLGWFSMTISGSQNTDRLKSWNEFAGFIVALATWNMFRMSDQARWLLAKGRKRRKELLETGEPNFDKKLEVGIGTWLLFALSEILVVLAAFDALKFLFTGGTIPQGMEGFRAVVNVEALAIAFVMNKIIAIKLGGAAIRATRMSQDLKLAKAKDAKRRAKNASASASESSVAIA